jgi:hypothetical protein
MSYPRFHDRRRPTLDHHYQMTWVGSSRPTRQDALRQAPKSHRTPSTIRARAMRNGARGSLSPAHTPSLSTSGCPPLHPPPTRLRPSLWTSATKPRNQPLEDKGQQRATTVASEHVFVLPRCQDRGPTRSSEQSALAFSFGGGGGATRRGEIAAVAAIGTLAHASSSLNPEPSRGWELAVQLPAHNTARLGAAPVILAASLLALPERGCLTQRRHGALRLGRRLS